MEINNALKVLSSLLGKDRIFTSEHYKSLYSYDSTNVFSRPDAVLFPQSEEDVVNIAKTATQFKVPLVARGSGTSRSGGPVPVKGGFVICFSKMNRIKEIDRTNMLAVAEPGVITQELNNEAGKYGLYYPPDPSSVKVSTIGGNISHNAGGIHAVKYGVTKNYLLGMRAVTIDGRVLRLGGKVVKSVVGYDIMRLISGSEGTLALITEATLRLIPRPQAKSLFLVPFYNEYGWIDLILRIYERGILPCSLEFMDSGCIYANKRKNEYEVISRTGIKSVLFIELDGIYESVCSESEKVKKVFSETGISEYLSSDKAEEIESIWDIRRDVSPSLNMLGEYRVADDVSVPLGNLRDAVSELKKFAEENSFKLAIFGHAGDSNLHVNFMFDSKDEMEKNFDSVMRAVSSVVLKYGGSISGEHGIGFLKRDYSEYELDVNALSMMKELKKIFDPYNLLNPGKIFSNH